ncbi:MAG: hypothetical protein P8127_12440 [Acidobacteriota bacterium]
MIKLGLRIRFFLYSNTLIVVTMILVAVLGAMYQRRILFDAIVGRGPITYVEGRRDVGDGERGLIESYVAEVMVRNKDVMRYVVVTDPSGTVTHSSHPENVGDLFARALAPGDDDGGSQADE